MNKLVRVWFLLFTATVLPIALISSVIALACHNVARQETLLRQDSPWHCGTPWQTDRAER